MSPEPTAPPEFFLDEKKSLACIHCGLCLSSCPTYLETGNENNSPRGRIYTMRAIQDGRMDLQAEPVRHLDLCLGCRACEAVCPSGVEYGALLEATRHHVERKFQRPVFQRILRRWVIEKIFPFPSRMKVALWPARLARWMKGDRWMPGFAREALSLLPPTISDEPLPERSPAVGSAQGRVGFIRGCVMSVLFGFTNQNSVRLLNAAGFDVFTPASQGCCGALYAHNGNLEEARAAARKNIEVFEALGLDAIIINAAGCGSTLKEYGHLLHEDKEWATRAADFSAKVKDLTEWLFLHRPRGVSREARKVTYHDACHLAHAQRITRQPRELVKAIAGSHYVELPEADVCCGSAGSYNLTEPEMARRLQERKIKNLLQTGADIVVTTNPGCLLQIQAGLRRAGSAMEIYHIADFLAEHYARRNE